MTKPTFPVGVNSIVVRDGAILLGQRNHGFGAGTWCLPGGHLEFGEKVRECAARELLEETTMTARDFTFASLINEPRRDVHYIHICLVAQEPHGEPVVTEPDKFSAWQWFPLNALPEVYLPHQEPIKMFLSAKEVFKD